MQYGALANRKDAGAKLACLLKNAPGVSPASIILGLVRGGAVVAAELASRLGLHWDIYIVRKIGAPHQEEFAVGAICEQGTYIFNHEVLEHFDLSSNWQAKAITKAQAKCQKLQTELRHGKPLLELSSREVILCDDGMATGLSMQVAIEGVRSLGASSVSVAVPVLSNSSLKMLNSMDVQGHYLACPQDFRAVGLYYQDFRPVETKELAQLLAARNTNENHS